MDKKCLEEEIKQLRAELYSELELCNVYDALGRRIHSNNADGLCDKIASLQLKLILKQIC
jgi:hypothetical protein